MIVDGDDTTTLLNLMKSESLSEISGELLGRRLVSEALSGFNANLFCYGQTASGNH